MISVKAASQTPCNLNGQMRPYRPRISIQRLHETLRKRRGALAARLLLAWLAVALAALFGPCCELGGFSIGVAHASTGQNPEHDHGSEGPLAPCNPHWASHSNPVVPVAAFAVAVMAPVAPTVAGGVPLPAASAVPAAVFLRSPPRAGPPLYLRLARLLD